MKCGWNRLELVLCSWGERLMEAAQPFWLSLASQTGLGESKDAPVQVTSSIAMSTPVAMLGSQQASFK